MEKKINAIKKENSNLEKSLEDPKLTPAERQLIYDKISSNKREIEQISKEERKPVVLTGLPTVSQRNNNSSFKTRLKENKIYL